MLSVIKFAFNLILLRLVGSQAQCFENYLDLVNLTYYGPSSGLTPPKKSDSKPQKEVTQ